MVGIDEVGRGCLAGPLLVVAARPLGILPDGLGDSKALSRVRREELFELLAGSCEFGEGWVTPSEISRLGLAASMRLGVRRAMRGLKAGRTERIIMDGPINYAPKFYTKVECLIDADALIPIVSAASIFAKVKRDNYMRVLGRRHKRYGFATNVGYGTAEHLKALSEHGYLKRVHRRSFEPIRLLEQTNLC